MNCTEIGTHLALGGRGWPVAAATEARRHAAGCLRCAATLAAMERLEVGLSSLPTEAAPPDFSDRVMDRVWMSEMPVAEGSTATLSPARSHHDGPAAWMLVLGLVTGVLASVVPGAVLPLLGHGVAIATLPPIFGAPAETLLLGGLAGWLMCVGLGGVTSRLPGGEQRMG